MKKPTLHRKFGLEISESAAKELEELRKDLGVESLGEVFRKALQTFKALRDQQKNGRKVVIISKQGVEQELISL